MGTHTHTQTHTHTHILALTATLKAVTAGMYRVKPYWVMGEWVHTHTHIVHTRARTHKAEREIGRERE